jgi:hypothetical protein
MSDYLVFFIFQYGIFSYLIPYFFMSMLKFVSSYSLEVFSVVLSNFSWLTMKNIFYA